MVPRFQSRAQYPAGTTPPTPQSKHSLYSANENRKAAPTESGQEERAPRSPWGQQRVQFCKGADVYWAVLPLEAAGAISSESSDQGKKREHITKPELRGLKTVHLCLVNLFPIFLMQCQPLPSPPSVSLLSVSRASRAGGWEERERQGFHGLKRFRCGLVRGLLSKCLLSDVLSLGYRKPLPSGDKQGILSLRQEVKTPRMWALLCRNRCMTPNSGNEEEGVCVWHR